MFLKHTEEGMENEVIFFPKNLACKHFKGKKNKKYKLIRVSVVFDSQPFMVSFS